MSLDSALAIAKSVRDAGHCLVPGVISPGHIVELNAILDSLDSAGVRRRGDMYAVRNLFDAAPEICALARDPGVRAAAEAVCGADCFAVQAILLDKIPDANWKVPFHQDLYIPVAQRVDAPGFSGWSEKAGVVHAKPPASVLESVLTMRIHLDDCGTANGPLRVIPGSHRHGELTSADIARLSTERSEAVCCARSGNALLIRPLLLHASSPAATPRHRRVIQIQFANGELPGGVRWHVRV